MSQPRGWLVNQERRERREQPFTLVDKHVQALIDTILTGETYSKEDERVDRLLRLRDSALCALAWTWFKRGGEDLAVKLNQVFIGNGQITVTFFIEKKSKSYKICPHCDDKGRPVKNAKKSNFCKNCGERISEVMLTKTKPKPVPAVKSKSIDWPFTKYIATWVKELKKIGVPEDSYLFPPFISRQGRFEFGRHITVQRFDQILQNMDPTLTSSFFRYGHTEKLKRLKYPDSKIATIGDWESDRMPRIYGKRKGITEEEQEFAEDMRTL